MQYTASWRAIAGDFHIFWDCRVGEYGSESVDTVCYVYVLGSGELGALRTYVGWTVDLERRLVAHNSGKGARSTRGRAWRIIYAERCEDKRAAMRREWRLKRDRGFRKALSLHVTGEGGNF